MDITIRKAVMEDVENLISNRMDFQIALGIQPTEEFRKATKEYLYDHLNDGSLLCYIAVDDGHIVASVIFSLYQVLPTMSNITGNVGYVFNVFTEKEYRKQGLATSLMQCGIDEARQLGTGELFLEATDDGKRVYESLHFNYLDREMHLRLI